MNRSIARRAGPLLAATAGLLLTAAGAVPRGQNVAAPPPVQWPTPPVPDGPIGLQSAEVRDFRAVVLSKTLEQPWSLAFLYVLTGENAGAVLRLEPVEATTTR